MENDAACLNGGRLIGKQEGHSSGLFSSRHRAPGIVQDEED